MWFIWVWLVSKATLLPWVLTAIPLCLLRVTSAQRGVLAPFSDQASSFLVNTPSFIFLPVSYFSTALSKGGKKRKTNKKRDGEDDCSFHSRFFKYFSFLSFLHSPLLFLLGHLCAASRLEPLTSPSATHFRYETFTPLVTSHSNLSSSELLIARVGARLELSETLQWIRMQPLLPLPEKKNNNGGRRRDVVRTIFHRSNARRSLCIPRFELSIARVTFTTISSQQSGLVAYDSELQVNAWPATVCWLCTLISLSCSRCTDNFNKNCWNAIQTQYARSRASVIILLIVADHWLLTVNSSISTNYGSAF